MGSHDPERPERAAKTLWTIQTAEAWALAQSRGYLAASPAHIDTDFRPAYDWMRQAMRRRIGEPPAGITYPVWAWVQYANACQRKPDLRRTAHLPKGCPGVRIGFTAPAATWLPSCFQRWHCVLNRWYLPTDEADSDRFDAEAHRLNAAARRAQIRASWERIFALDALDPYWGHPEEQPLQATLWRVELGAIQDVTAFRAR